MLQPLSAKVGRRGGHVDASLVYDKSSQVAAQVPSHLRSCLRAGLLVKSYYDDALGVLVDASANGKGWTVSWNNGKTCSVVAFSSLYVVYPAGTQSPLLHDNGM
jgi:hypothetical protein